MRLPRLQLFELEDQGWFPRTIRDMGIDYIQFLESRFALHKPIITPLCEALEQSGATSVIDFCSGAGGPVPAIYECLLERGKAVPFLLTDRFPNIAALRGLASRYGPAISYAPESIDAANPPAGLAGLRTMFNAFHHFPPQTARSILAGAVKARAPIAIFEFPDRALSTILSLCLTPLLVAIATPFIRPFRWQRLLWTYLLPVVPLMCWWDGIVSQLRAYRTEEMLQLTEGLEEYRWQVNRITFKFGVLTYLWGCHVPAHEEGSEFRGGSAALFSRGAVLRLDSQCLVEFVDCQERCRPDADQPSCTNGH